MPALRNDLLSNTRVLLRWAFFIDAGLVLLLALLLVAVFVGDPSRMNITGALAATPEGKLLAARIGISGGLVCTLLALPLLRSLLAIVDSARNGDPFVPENGARLRRIGWLLLAINLVVSTVVSVVVHKGITFPPISFTALLTVLMIFVLARIFDTGTRMREDLRDTV
jgi:hypothetical protein